MKFSFTLVLAALLSSMTWAAQKNSLKMTAPAQQPSEVQVMTLTPVTETANKNALAFNFVGLSKGKTNIYLDVGGFGSKVSPSLSFRSYSNIEKVKKLGQQEVTVDRTLVTLGASIEVFKGDKKSLLLNPYMYFGSEKNLLETSTKNGLGVRLVGQFQMTQNFGVQVGLDGNNVEGPFVNDAYLGGVFFL